MLALLLPVARFELRYQLRNPVFWVVGLLFFLLAFAMIAAGRSPPPPPGRCTSTRRCGSRS